MRRARLTVHVSTKLNRSHAVTGAPRADPAHPRPHRHGPPGRRRAVRHRRGLDEHGARLPRPPRARQPPPALRGGDRRPAGPRASSAPTAAPPWEEFEADYAHDPRPHRPRRPRLRGLQRPGRAAPAASPCRTPRATSGSFPTATGKAIFTAAPVEYPAACPRAGCCCRPCARHDQYNTTIYGLDDRYRGIQDGRRVVLVNPDDARALGLADGATPTWSASGTTASSAAPPASASSPTRPPAAARPPTTPRPTSWSRSTPPPTPATPRPASRSSIRAPEPTGATALSVAQPPDKNSTARPVDERRRTEPDPMGEQHARQVPAGDPRRVRRPRPRPARPLLRRAPRRAHGRRSHSRPPPDRVVGTMPVEGNTQPYGLLHGGASAVLAETLGSVGAMLHGGPTKLAVGVDLNCTHHRGVRSGTGHRRRHPRTPRPLHRHLRDRHHRRAGQARLHRPPHLHAARRTRTPTA